MDKVKKRELSGLPLVWNMPGVWWRRMHWFKRVLVSIVFIGVISGISIGVYAAYSQRGTRDLVELQAEKIGELSDLYAQMKVDQGEIQAERNQEILEELATLRDELERYRVDSRASGVLGASSDLDSSIDSAIAALESISPGESNGLDGEIFGYITINDIKWDGVEAHEIRFASSKSIGQLEYGELYPVYDYEDGWYKIDTLGGGKGWVQEQFMKEVAQ